MNAIELQEYRDAAAAVRAEVARDLAQVLRHTGPENRLGNLYHMADANLRYFFPQLSRTQTHALIADILYQQRMALADQRRYHLVERTRVIDEAGVFDDPATPRIFCTYHTGSYRHLLQLLGARGIDCLLYIAGRTLGLQGGSIVSDSTEAAALHGWRGKLDTLDADNPASLLQGVRALRRGRSVVIYIDGNSGSGAANEREASVEFFGRRLRARSGVAYLSHLAQVPIVPSLCRRDGDANLSLHFQAPITPADGDRTSYAIAATRELFARLAAAIAADPGQWEGWLHVHKQVQRQPDDVPPAQAVEVPTTARWSADQERFAILRFMQQPVLLDKLRHSCSMLDQTAEAAFHAASNGETLLLDSSAAAASVRQLLSVGALRPVGV